MSRRTRANRTRSRIRERGAILVEAAIIAPIAIALVFGAMELGYAYYGKLTVEHMSIAGARAASGSANDYLADYNMLQAVEDAKTSMGASAINKIVIYRAANPSDRVPTACKSGPVTNTSSTRGCNYYTGADLTLASSQFGCVGPPGPTTKKDQYWCPTTRKSALLSTNGNGPPDYVGVYVVATHKNLIGLFGKTFTFSNDTVIRVEPRTLR
jgi:Flp pilus assembly protein TadG